MSYMMYDFKSCWVVGSPGSHEPTFSFRKVVTREELIELCRLWQPERIIRLR